MMKTLLFLPCFFLSLATLPAQDLNFVAQSGRNASGTICDPWTCAPAPVTAWRGNRLALNLAGAVGQPHFLAIAHGQPQCVTIPGIARSLILPTPATIVPMELTWGRIYSYTPPGQSSCGGWMGFGALDIPANAAAGTRFLLQAVAPVRQITGGQLWTFSNAVEVTLR